MGDIAIKVEKISKKFQIGRRQTGYKTLRDTMADAFLSPFRKAGKLLRGQATGAANLDETIWALRDVSFEIKQGEVVGIIGRNGAGKSTLLKILSRITEPTSGFADVHGRIGSLLEVGTGFHPELTGRENIYLNGSILGIKRREIERKFDEIVDFSEVDKFIDTPVKHYSSGMYLRLAFAVAAYLEAEILLVDEVLAVGDARFQKKCLSKMKDVGQEGRTVIFVSHNMPAITRLCERAILIDEGTVAMDDKSHQVVSAYLNSGRGTKAERMWPEDGGIAGGEIARPLAVRVLTQDGQTTDVVDIQDPVGIEFEYAVLKSGYIVMPYHHIFNEDGINIFQIVDTDPAWRNRRRPQGRYMGIAWIPGNFLSEGAVFVSSGIITLDPLIPQFYENDVVAFQVVENHGSPARGDFVGRMGGAVRPLLKWTNHITPA